MPELPEVETIRRGLAPVLEGQIIARAQARRPDLRWPLPVNFDTRLTGRRVLQLRRRSKFLLADLDSGETLIAHMGMSGRMLIAPGTDAPHDPPGKHDHVILHTGAGTRITFNDARRFGAMDLASTDGLGRHAWLALLGPEPLGNVFSEEYLHARLRGRRSVVKSALLDQRIVAGLGNIYVCEALHRAGIAPSRLAGSIGTAGLARLVPAIRDVLSEAIEAGGSSLRDFRQADGSLGYFQHGFRVYGRAGARCPSHGCSGTIRRDRQGGRSSFHCPICQR